jgi:hypothetical protein
VADNVTVGADTVIPPFTRVTMNRGRLVQTPLPPGTYVPLQEDAAQRYHDFVASQKQQ